MNDRGDLKIEIVEGPLKGESRLISKQAASTVGRSSENAICVPDKELSRRHSKIEFDRDLSEFVVSDYGSTNGTYIQLVGPYGGRLRLNLNDHILVGRTGFSINRYDFGVSEEIGHRQTMEDSCTIVQHLNMSSLCVRDLSPHSFFGVFDGHGGSEASTYLSQNLHINVSDGLMRVAEDLLSVLENASIWTDMGAKERDLSISHSPGDAKKTSLDSSQLSDGSRGGGGGGQTLTRNMSSFSVKEKLDCIVMKALKEAFLKTDNDFLTTSNHPQHGSTATIALILGDQLSPLFCTFISCSSDIHCT
jgi:serine/threonine protein phosphatase PrpC